MYSRVRFPAGLLLFLPSPTLAPDSGAGNGIGTPIQTSTQERKDMNMTISHADDFTRSHPVLTGKRKGTTLRERLERIRDTTRKASVRKAAEQWLRETEATA